MTAASLTLLSRYLLWRQRTGEKFRYQKLSCFSQHLPFVYKLQQMSTSHHCLKGSVCPITVPRLQETGEDRQDSVTWGQHSPASRNSLLCTLLKQIPPLKLISLHNRYADQEISCIHLRCFYRQPVLVRPRAPQLSEPAMSSAPYIQHRLPAI